MPLLVPAIAALVLVASCGPPPAARRADVESYLQKMSAWAPIEAETARTLERILATQFVDEAEVIRQISDNGPRVRIHLAQAEAYTPRTEDVLAVHRIYLDAWRRLLAGYQSIETGFRTGEYQHLAIGREAFAAWRDSLLSTADRLSELRDDTGAEFHPVRPS